jgi:hypothetical protein
LSKRWSREQRRRSGAYHEAAHAVVDGLEGHIVRYVSIAIEGTNNQDICVSAVNHHNVAGVGLIPAPWEALGHATATLAGNIAMWREFGKTEISPWDNWEGLVQECEEIEELGDPEELENDAMEIRKYCEAAALLGQMVRMPTPDELLEGSPPLTPPLPRTAKEAFEVALGAAEERVNTNWPAIVTVAEKLMDAGYLTGDEVEEVVFSSELFQGETS